MAEEVQLLVPLEKYLASGIHVGTKFRTRSMEPFIYKVNPNGLCILNVSSIDERLRRASKILSQYDPKEILVVCRRENGWKAVKKFGEITGANVFAGRYPAGIITNPALETFFEPKIMVVVDPWPDKNAVNDALNSGIPIIALVDSNNTLNNVDYAIPSNNKGSKSIGIVFWILANQYLKERGLLPREKDIDAPLEEFTD